MENRRLAYHFSNTEPLLRLGVEAATEEGLEKRKAELIGKIRLGASANPAE
jgi:phosphomannomutase